jgi:hypothetical protein
VGEIVFGGKKRRGQSARSAASSMTGGSSGLQATEIGEMLKVGFSPGFP